MKTRKVLLSSALAVATLLVCASAKKTTSPVLLNVGGKDVTLNEFEYLYHKNNTQQQTPQSIDEYLQMFIDYKLKVAEAEAAGIDTTASFISEFNGYSRDLARPYLTDTAVEDALCRKEYERLKENVDVSHIMIPLGDTPAESQMYAERLDSIRTAILNGSDFETLARQFSIDRSAANNGGHMGWIMALRYPYTFEDAAWDTPVGEISPVIKTPYGHHIVKVNARRPDRGQVHARHIIKTTRNLSPEEAAAKKAAIDSISAELKAGRDFQAVAAKESEDGSARRGGDLGFFGAGQMVPEFEEVVFSLKDGEISEPFETRFGFHIVERVESKPVGDYETMLPDIKQAMQQDERSLIPVRERTRQLIAKYNGKTDTKVADRIRKAITDNGGVDSTLMATLRADNTPIITINKTDIPVSKIFANYFSTPDSSVDDCIAEFDHNLEARLGEAAQEAERANLAVTNDEYRNLLNEYRDGILLFEISDRNVWSKAKEDKEGLKAFFERNRSKYHWDAPKFKSYIIFATSDSIANAAREYLDNNSVDNDKLVDTLRKLYGKDIKVERVIAAKGDNAITDYLGFGADKPEATGRWTSYFAYKGRVIDQPEEPADERGAVTADYQVELEQQWLKHLRDTYPVKVNDKVLKKAK